MSHALFFLRGVLFGSFPLWKGRQNSGWEFAVLGLGSLWMFADVVPSFDFGIIILYEIIACARVLLMRHLEETSQISAADFFYRNNLFEHRRLHRMLTDQDTECCPRWIRLRHRQETEEEEDVVFYPFFKNSIISLIIFLRMLFYRRYEDTVLDACIICDLVVLNKVLNVSGSIIIKSCCFTLCCSFNY